MGSWGPSAAERSEELPPVVQWTPQTVQEQEESPILPVIVEEDLGKRGEYEKHFLCDDGSYMAVSYPEPVHMRREPSGWTSNTRPPPTGRTWCPKNREAG